MRALCGAIITAGALIGLGLVTIGIGERYRPYPYQPNAVEWKNLDTPFIVAMVATLLSLVIGLGIAYVGLAYHHHRRHHEMRHLHGATTTPRSPV